MQGDGEKSLGGELFGNPSMHQKKNAPHFIHRVNGKLATGRIVVPPQKATRQKATPVLKSACGIAIWIEERVF